MLKPNLKHYFAFCWIVLLCSLATQVNADKPDSVDKVAEPYVLGVFPFLPPRELEKIFAPFAASIGSAIDKEVLFKSSNSYRNFMERSNAQSYDIAYVQPFDYVRLADKYNYLPLATRGERLATVFVVKENSPINSTEDLKGKVIATPPTVAAVTRLALNFFHKNNLVPGIDVKLTHHRSHVSCLQQVLIGVADVCSSAPPPVRFMQQKMKVKFKIIAKTVEIPHVLFIVHKRVPKAKRELIRSTILSWSTTDPGRKMLSRGKMRPFVPVNDKDYDLIRNMIQAEKRMKLQSK